jgi:hypothetical protein
VTQEVTARVLIEQEVTASLEPIQTVSAAVVQEQEVQASLLPEQTVEAALVGEEEAIVRTNKSAPPPPLTVTYDDYAMATSGDDAKVQYTTSAPITTNFKWRESGGSWHYMIDPLVNLIVLHHVTIGGPFGEGVTFEFQALGKDIEGDNHSGDVKTFANVGGVLQFTEA